MIHNPETKLTSGSAQEVHPYKIRASTQNWELKTSQSGQEVSRAERLLKPSSRAPSSREDTKKQVVVLCGRRFSSQSPEQFESRSPTESPELLGECFISLYCFQLQYFFSFHHSNGKI